MADVGDQSSVSTVQNMDCDVNTTKAHDEDNSSISNSAESETVVNNEHAVGRDAGSLADRRDASGGKEQTYDSEQEGGGQEDGDAADMKMDSCEADQNSSLQLTETASVSSMLSTNDQAVVSQNESYKANSLFNLDDSGSSVMPNLEEGSSADCSQDENYLKSNLNEFERLAPPKATEIVGDDVSVRNTNSAREEVKHEETCEDDETEKFNVESLSYELQVGYRILSNMMSTSNRCVNKLFLFPVDDNFPETASYYEKVKNPMWMFKMKEKFESHQYEDITEFTTDFRLMIENCYRFNGPDNFVSKKAQKLETMMKQKVALLSKNLRDKIMGASVPNEDDMLTSAGLRRRVRNPNTSMDDASQQLLSQLRKDREMQEKVDRRQKVEDRRAMELARLQELQSWEDNLIGLEIREHIRTMWELPQIGLFVYLCMESLGLEEEVTQYQIERGLAVPRECSDFGRLMTCLLSTPHQRKNLKSFMPYHVWNTKLTEKLDFFYKVLSEKNLNHTQACYKLGFDLRAFKMMGKSNPLRKKKFHELTFLKRVWVLKNYCDFCLETQSYLQKTIEDIEAVRPNDVREVLLGSDGRGYRYLNFPMFTGKDIRIFKHQKIPEPTLESLCMEDWSVDTEKPSASSSRCSTPINQRNVRQAETPLNSLRARALLQAAESKEASPFRDSSRAGSESMDSSHQQPSSESLENSQSTSAVKPVNPKKRKKTSIFTGKKKRLKIKKTDVSAAATDCGDVSYIEEESFVNNESLADSASEAASTSTAQKHVTESDHSHSVCDIVQTNKEGDKSNISNKNTPCVAYSDCSSTTANKSSISTENVPFENGVDSVSKTRQTSDEGSSAVLDSSEGVLCSQQQLDSAYLSCESDKSGRDDEELGNYDGSEPSRSKIEDSSVQHSFQTKEENPSQAEEDAIKGSAEGKVEVKEESQLKTALDANVKLEAEIKKEEGFLEKPALNENVKSDSVDLQLVKLKSPEGGKDSDEGEKILQKLDIKKEEDISLEEKRSIKVEETQCESSVTQAHVSEDKNSDSMGQGLCNGNHNTEESSSHEKMDTSESLGTSKSNDADEVESHRNRTLEDANEAESDASKSESRENILNDTDEAETHGNKSLGTDEAISKTDQEEIMDTSDIPENSKRDSTAKAGSYGNNSTIASDAEGHEKNKPNGADDAESHGNKSNGVDDVKCHGHNKLNDVEGHGSDKTNGVDDATSEADKGEGSSQDDEGSVAVNRGAEESKETEEESDEDEDDLPERGRIELVAESMEEIRQLMNKLSNPEPIKRGKKVYPGVIKPCEEELLANLTRFHDDLLKFEKSLINARTGMQVKLRKEVDNYTEPKMEESKGWDSDHSQSTKDSSEDEEEEQEEEPDSKAEMETGRKSKRIKAKQQVAATTSLLTSAASKLSAISDSITNEDSNDSFELDISSRGRLRKRRIIPNNTEDTGLRKRKLVDLGLGTSTPSTGADAEPSSCSSSMPVSSPASAVSHPTVIQQQPGKPWPSHILSMLTSGGLTASSSAIRAQLGGQLVTSKAGSSSGLQQHLLAGQVFRLVTPGADSNVRALHVSASVAGGRSLHAAPGSVIISPQNLASIRFVSSTGVVTLPRERILSAGAAPAASTSSTPAQASHPVIQQLLLNKSSKGNTSSSKVTFVPTVTVNGGSANQILQQQQQHGLSGPSVSKMSVVVTLASAASSLTLQHPVVTANRSSVMKPSMVMVTPQNSSKPGGATAVPAVSAAPVVVSQVSSSLSGGKQVLDLGSLSVTQIQQLMRNQAIQINMGGAGSGPTTLLLTTGLQQLGASTSTSTSLTSAGIRPQQHQLQQTIRPSAVATGASSLLAIINSKGQKLVSSTAAAAVPGIANSTVTPSQHGIPSHLETVITPQASTNSALKSVLSNRGSFPQPVFAGKILSSSFQNRMPSGTGNTISTNTDCSGGQTARTIQSMPQIISSLPVSAPVTATTIVTIPSSQKAAAISSCSSGVGKDTSQQKARTIITVPLVHLSSPGKKYASNVTVKALLENRAPKKTELDDNLKNMPLSVEGTMGASQNITTESKAENAALLGSQSKENEIPVSNQVSESTSRALLTSLTVPLTVSTGGLECTTSEVIVPTVHIKVPSPNTLPSVLHNKNGTTIVQSTKVPIAVASEAKASEMSSPSSGHENMLQSSGLLAKESSSVSLSLGSMMQTSSAPVTVSGGNLQQNQPQGVKNVMLKVTPQSGGSGQFVQGFMTSRGLVIPQSALVQQQQQQQQGKNVLLANVAQNGTLGSSGQLGNQQTQQAQGLANLPVQQAGLNIIGQASGTVIARQQTQQTPSLNQPQQPLQVLGTAQNSSSAVPFPNQVQKGTVMSSGGLKFMLVNPVGQTSTLATGQATSLASHQVLAAAAVAKQPQTSTPAAELVKQIAANSIQVQSSSQAGLVTPPGNSVLSPRLVQKSNVVMRAPPGVMRMSVPSVASTSPSPRAPGSSVQQTGLGTGGVLSGQTIINSNVSPSNISPQLAAQILALQQQQQQQQQQQNIVLAGGKPASVGQQLQQNQPGTPSMVTLQLQQLGQLFSSLTQLQPGGVQQQQPQQQPVAAGQQPGQVVQLSLNPGQTLLSGGGNPQPPQLVKLGAGQVSPQIQLATGQIQSSQGAGLVLQQPQAGQLASQNLLLQQKQSSQPNIGLQQPNALQPLHSQLQQQQASIIKLPQQATSISMKPQLSVASPLPSSQQALQVLQNQQNETNTNHMSTSSTSVSLSLSQGFVVSPATAGPLSGNQQQRQVQFVLNPSSLATSITSGVPSLSTLNKLPGGNIRRVIRADSSLLQTSLTSSSPSVAPQVGNIANPAVVVGGTGQVLNTTQLQGSKRGLTQMLVPTSTAGSGQILISPMKIGASPQANVVSPLKLLGSLQVASSGTTSSSHGNQLVMNNNQLPGTILGKPSVIYASQPAQVRGSLEKSEASKILLSHPNGNLLQINKGVNASSMPILSSHQQVVMKPTGQVLQTPTASVQVKQLPASAGNLGSSAGAKTYLYKVGEQYFSPTGPLAVSGSQFGPVTSTLTSIPTGTVLLPSKPDVQLLVPPACIEASEKMVLQSSRNVHTPSGNVKLYHASAEQSSESTTSASSSSTSSNCGTANGTNFSFSLSGPTCLSKPQAAGVSGEQSKTTGVAAELLRKDGVNQVQSGMATNAGDAASLSAVSTAATGDEEEAAMNLLTLANQAV